MTVSVSTSSVGGFSSLVIENSRLRAIIIPELGGRVWELLDRSNGRQWIWHRNDVSLTAAATGDNYDDVWAGGWEELFPNDAPCRFEGRELPDHGEMWTMRWKVLEASSGPSAVVELSAKSTVVKAACTKKFRLERDSNTLTVSYRIRSQEPRAFHFLFKQHLAIGIAPDCRLALPGGRVQAVDPAFSTVLPEPGPFDWPFAGTGADLIDLRNIPDPSSRARDFVYVRDLPETWCGVEDYRAGASIRMEFERRRMPYVWLFLAYGGWRDLYTAVLEPCSNLPKDLSEAVRLGQSARLEPGKEFKTKVSVTLSGLDELQT